LRYLEKRGVITFAAAPGDDEMNAILGEDFGAATQTPCDGLFGCARFK
jgi:hypothetical protein